MSLLTVCPTANKRTTDLIICFLVVLYIGMKFYNDSILNYNRLDLNYIGYSESGVNFF